MKKPPATSGTTAKKEKVPRRRYSAAESVTDKVSRAVTRGIRTGMFVPGQHLLEPELTKRLHISRGSLREALKHLAAAGIVTLSRHRGAYISALDKKSVLDLLITLEPLSRLAAQLAAQKCDTAEKARSLLDAVEGIETANRAGNRGEYLEQRRRFYDAMVRIGENAELERAMPLARTDLFRAQLERVQSEVERHRHAAGYAKITSAIVARDEKAADRAVHQHFRGTIASVTRLPETAFFVLGGD